MPVELQLALEQNAVALKNFEQLAPSFRRHYILWIVMAKRPETWWRNVSRKPSSFSKKARN